MDGDEVKKLKYEAVSEATKARWADPEYRARLVAKFKEYRADPEYRARQSATMKKKWEDPEYRERCIAAIRKMNLDPEVKAHRVEHLREYHKNPDIVQSSKWAIRGFLHPVKKAEVHEQQMQMWRDPEARDEYWEKQRKKGNTKAAKLSDDDVRMVRSMLKDGYRVNEVAAHFNVIQPIISYIKTGKTYKHVKDED